MDDKKTYNAQEAAKYLDRSDTTVLNYLKKGLLPGKRIKNPKKGFPLGPKWWWEIQAADLEEFKGRLDAGEVFPPPKGRTPDPTSQRQQGEVGHMYLPTSQDNITSICEAIDPQTRLALLEKARDAARAGRDVGAILESI